MTLRLSPRDSPSTPTATRSRRRSPLSRLKARSQPSSHVARRICISRSRGSAPSASRSRPPQRGSYAPSPARLRSAGATRTCTTQACVTHGRSTGARSRLTRQGGDAPSSPSSRSSGSASGYRRGQAQGCSRQNARVRPRPVLRATPGLGAGRRHGGIARGGAAVQVRRRRLRCPATPGEEGLLRGRARAEGPRTSSSCPGPSGRRASIETSTICSRCWRPPP